MIGHNFGGFLMDMSELVKCQQFKVGLWEVIVESGTNTVLSLTVRQIASKAYCSEVAYLETRYILFVFAG